MNQIDDNSFRVQKLKIQLFVNRRSGVSVKTISDFLDINFTSARKIAVNLAKLGLVRREKRSGENGLEYYYFPLVEKSNPVIPEKIPHVKLVSRTIDLLTQRGLSQ